MKKQTTSSKTLRPPRKWLGFALLANAFEWYEFAVYGFLSYELGQLFFNSDHPIMALIKGFMPLMLGYFARPLGSILFGLYGDRIGRRHALRLSLILMTVPTVLIGVIPTYSQVGLYATFALILLRLIQGFSAGGESPLITSYIFEATGGNSLWCSAVAASPLMGILLGSCVSALLTTCCPQEALFSWGWRIPFLLGIPLSLFIMYVRETIQEIAPISLSNKHPKEKTKPPYPFFKSLMVAICLFAFTNASIYTLVIWMPYYLEYFLKISPAIAKFTNTITISATVLFYLSAGYVSQRYGYRKILIVSLIASLLFVLPTFKGLQFYSSFWSLLTLQCLLALLAGMANSTFPEVANYAFRPERRGLGCSLAMTLPATFIGGPTPILLTYVIHKTGWLLFPAFYIMAFSLLALPAAVCFLDNPSYSTN